MISGLSAKLVPSETTLLPSATSLHAEVSNQACDMLHCFLAKVLNLFFSKHGLKDLIPDTLIQYQVLLYAAFIYIRPTGSPNHRHDHSLKQTDQLQQLTQACMAVETAGDHCPEPFVLTPKSSINAVGRDDARQV